MKIIIQSLRIYLVLTLLTGITYPLAMTGFAQLAFPQRANGSVLSQNGKRIGSDLLAQKFEDPRYFWPRPSAADFATVASGASNKGPTSADLRKAIEERREKFAAEAPIDLLTASGSGLDPHLSPEAVRWQIKRVAEARGLTSDKVEETVARFIEPPQLGFLGQPRINMLRLNLALDQTR